MHSSSQFVRVVLTYIDGQGECNGYVDWVHDALRSAFGKVAVIASSLSVVNTMEGFDTDKGYRFHRRLLGYNAFVDGFVSR